MNKVVEAFKKRKQEKADKEELEASLHYSTRTPTSPPPGTLAAVKKHRRTHSTPIARLDFTFLEESRIDNSIEVDSEISFKPIHQPEPEQSSDTEDDTSSEASSDLLRDAQLSWDDSSHAGKMELQQATEAGTSPQNNQPSTASPSNAAGSTPAVTLEMLMQHLTQQTAKMDEQRRENKEDNKAMRAEVTEKMDKQNQDLKDLALKLDRSIEYFKNTNNDVKKEVEVPIFNQSSGDTEDNQKDKFKQYHSEETLHLVESGATPCKLAKGTDTESGQNPIQKPNDHTQEDEDIEKQVTVLEEILHIRTEILEVPPTQELLEDECKEYNVIEEELLPEHMHDVKKTEKRSMEVSIDYDVLQVNHQETTMGGSQFGMDQESYVFFHYYPVPQRRIILLKSHMAIALVQKLLWLERPSRNKRSLNKDVPRCSKWILQKILASLKYTGPPPEKGPPHKKSEKIPTRSDNQWSIIQIGLEADFELLDI